MDPGLVFRRISAALEMTQTPHMLTGSFASSYYEALRSTYDIDFVIAPSFKRLELLVRYLKEHDYYVELRAAVSAYRERSMFNALDNETGWKIDFHLQKLRAFSQEEFRRRKAVTFQGVPLSVATPEDVILAKLEWAKMGESHRQLEDAATVLRKQWRALDHEYLIRWATVLDLTAELDKARSLTGLQ